MSPRRNVSPLLPWAGIFLLLLVQFLWFDLVGVKSAVATWPRWNDQIQYLTEAYTAWEIQRTAGLAAAWWHTLTNPAAQGAWHDTATLFIFNVAGGPSRSAALALNALALIAWQIALYAALRSCSRTRDAAWLGLALPLLLHGPWLDTAGSVFDFRLDWLATCALGVCAALALATDGGRRRAWCLALGAVIGLTVGLRFLTLAYFIATAALVFLGLLATRQERARRLGGLAAATLLAAWVAVPFLWPNREVIWNYYIVGHFTGPESAIRAPGFDWTSSASWVLREWQHLHLGTQFWIITALAGLATAGLAWQNRHRGTMTFPAFPGFSFLLGPAALLLGSAVILTGHPQKSFVVLGNLSAGLIALLAWAIAALAGRAGPAWASRLSLAFLGLTFVLHLNLLTRTGPSPGVRADSPTVFSIVDQVAEISASRGWATPHVGVDRITDGLDAQVMRVVLYERHRLWVPLRMTLPTGIAETTDHMIAERLAASDFVIVSMTGEHGIWPYDQQLRRRRPETLAWVEAHLDLVREFSYEGETMRLYVRPENG